MLYECMTISFNPGLGGVLGCASGNLGNKKVAWGPSGARVREFTGEMRK